jgi:hypothetical protein
MRQRTCFDAEIEGAAYKTAGIATLMNWKLIEPLAAALYHIALDKN